MIQVISNCTELKNSSVPKSYSSAYNNANFKSGNQKDVFNSSINVKKSEISFTGKPLTSIGATATVLSAYNNYNIPKLVSGFLFHSGKVIGTHGTKIMNDNSSREFWMTTGQSISDAGRVLSHDSPALLIPIVFLIGTLIAYKLESS